MQELIRTPVHAPDSPSSAGMDIHETPTPPDMALDKLLDVAKMATDAINIPAVMALTDETSCAAEVETDKMLTSHGKGSFFYCILSYLSLMITLF